MPNLLTLTLSGIHLYRYSDHRVAPEKLVSAGHVFGRDPDGLLRNEAGSFRNVSAEAGLAEPPLLTMPSGSTTIASRQTNRYIAQFTHPLACRDYR